MIRNINFCSSILSDPMHKNELILKYYRIRGSAQPIRHLCYYFHITFTEEHASREEYSEVEFSGFGLGLPSINESFNEQSLKLNGQIAIMMYLCDRMNNKALIGLTPQTNARVNELLFKYATQKTRIHKEIIDGVHELTQETQSGDTHESKNGETVLKKLYECSNFIQVCLKHLNKGNRFILGQLTLTDFIFYEISFYVSGFYSSHISKDSIFMAFVKHKEAFEELDFFKKRNKQIHDIGLFYEPNSEELKETLAKNWNGKARLFVHGI